MITIAEYAAFRQQAEAARAARPVKGNFYLSRAWRELRYKALKQSNGCCECCGARATKGHPLHVDHVLPRSKFPHLALTLSNLQVLCDQCNLAKSNTDMTNWRNVR